ncbi:hypothetical protein ACVNF4_00160 [Streptomyces sp. S6]
MTYYEIMGADLSKLSTAADDWDAMGKDFDKHSGTYKKEVHGISLGDTWVGVSANAGSARFDVTLKEYQGAQREAKAVAKLLREAYAEFSRLRKKIEGIREDAMKAGMKISEQGAVAFDTSKLDHSEYVVFVHDPEYQESARTAACGWSEQLDTTVKAVNDADEGFKIALAAVIQDKDLLDGTVGGFNREAAASNPYPSLAETAKAQHMPKDKGHVAEWWRGLDPVTRGILLQEKGNELREAGIMSPLYKWHQADEGAGGFDTENPSGHDLWMLSVAQGIAAGGDVKGEIDASRNMEHYLGKSGERLNLDVNRMLHDDSDFRTQIAQNHIDKNSAAWRTTALDAFEKAGGDKAVVVPVESKAIGGYFKEGNWFHAVGGHQQNVSGMVTVTPGEHGKPKVTLDYQVNVWDRYNWDAGKTTEFPGGIVIADKDMAHLHKVGFAREYDMSGSSTIHSHDLDSSGTSTVAPGHSGREGTRGDVSRGDEENR